MTQRIFAFKGTFGQFENLHRFNPDSAVWVRCFSAYFADALDATALLLRAQRGSLIWVTFAGSTVGLPPVSRWPPHRDGQGDQ